MITELKNFQKRVRIELLNECDSAQREAKRRQQIVTLTAPTGAGKTLMITQLIEDIRRGYNDYVAQEDVIFLWLSDFPKLNEQSMQKIAYETRNWLPYGNLVMINEKNFDQRVLDDRNIYFINTDKLSANSNLVSKKGDKRNYTIWETLANTIKEKGNRLFLIIDEAHRGTDPGHKWDEANSIMQKFIKGSETDGLPSFPLIIGISATMQRFNKLIEGWGKAIKREVPVEAKEVKDSGLLKENILIGYPPKHQQNREMSMLREATLEWQDKCKSWHEYCEREKIEQVCPAFIIQVENGNDKIPTTTDLDGCLKIIEDVIGRKLEEGEVAHCFGDHKTEQPAKGGKIPYIDPTDIEADKQKKIIFFKEALTTGWDCPRAETMMSFRTAKDATYIEQLIGRMVRTPLHEHVSDATLNEVRLFLPRYDKDTVLDFVKKLNENMATRVSARENGKPEYQRLKVMPELKKVYDWLIEQEFLSYIVGGDKIGNYLKSLYKLANLVKNNTQHKKAKSEVTDAIVEMTKKYVDKLKSDGTYQEQMNELDNFVVDMARKELLAKGYELVEGGTGITLDYDLNKEYQRVNNKLEQEAGTEYLKKYCLDGDDIMEYKKHVILFVRDCMDEVEGFAKTMFSAYKDKYRRDINKTSDDVRIEYNDIVKENYEPKTTWRLEEPFLLTKGDSKYPKHLFVDENGETSFDMDGWEQKVIEYELEHNDNLVCWIRNTPVGQRRFCLLREQNKEEHSFWPDFLLVTKEDGEYVLNILEPHRKNEDDNYSKAEAMVNYVEQAGNPNIGRVELIRIENERILRLDFATSVVREEMKRVHNNDDLKNLFAKNINL